MCGTFRLIEKIYLEIKEILQRQRNFNKRRRRIYWVSERESNCNEMEKNKKDVGLISTIRTIEMQDETNKWGETKSRPKCVVDYNDKMDSVG
ncbi:hypothetical protein TNCT_521141 [Trichonephila clavata]|uniref:Uncharacterized protein n=1 Tax=Trichonephila clavata TaxID=2740835 RepID=A0A8X6EZV4_TRICU|nr:hypothetical protein TNCT_521141 [Trichonephila clavata]